MALPLSMSKLLQENGAGRISVEFAETWDPKVSLPTVCAFANDINNWGGGYIVIGVRAESGRPQYSLAGVPADRADAFCRDIQNDCLHIFPHCEVAVETAEHDGKKFIVVRVPGGSQRPYSLPEDASGDMWNRICYVRRMSRTVIPNEKERRDLFSLISLPPFDDRTSQEDEPLDLNITLIRSFLRDSSSPLYEESDRMEFLDLCIKMDIVNTYPEYVKPRNVGLLFFNFNPDYYICCAQIDIVEFPDNTGSSFTEKTFRGPLHHQLQEALQYIENCILQERIIKEDETAKATRFFNYPMMAVREALCNAVFHKGYDEREPIEVRVEPDRIIIVSHPGADPSISAEDLKQFKACSRRYRNRRIGEFLKELHLVRGQNSGFQKICDALRSNGSPEPLFETDEERTWFATTLYIHPGFCRGAGNGSDGNFDGNDGNHDGSGEHAELSHTETAVLREIRNDPKITAQSIAGRIGMSKPTVERAEKKLKEKGFIRRQGSTRGYWVLLE